MSSDSDQAKSADMDQGPDDLKVEAARAVLAAIDARVFPQSKEIPFYEQSVLIKRAVIRLFGNG